MSFSPTWPRAPLGSVLDPSARRPTPAPFHTPRSRPGQLDLERHGGHTPAGVLIRVLQRLLALTATIWHNDHTGQPVKRSLIAYDH